MTMETLEIMVIRCAKSSVESDIPMTLYALVEPSLNVSSLRPLDSLLLHGLQRMNSSFLGRP